MEPTVVADGLAIYLIGAGPPVLFMPGPHRFQRPGTRSGDAIIEGLLRLGRLVVTFDPPGSGRSTRPPDLGIPEMHACALQALTEAGVSAGADAFGHSMGGLALLTFALDFPGRVRRLVLVGTGSGGPAYMRADGALWHRGHPGFPAVAAAGSVHLIVRRLGSERVLGNLIESHSFRDATHAQSDSVAPRDWLRPAAGRADWHRIARRIDLRPRLGGLDVPVLVACGRHDPQFPLSCSTELAHRIRGAHLIVFDDSGHYPFIEQPEPFWTSVRAFLADPSR